MCEQCDAKVLVWHVTPGWSLVLARTEGDLMRVGEWGLVSCNDPNIVFGTTPSVDPCGGLPVDDEGVVHSFDDELDSEWHLAADKFNREFLVQPDIGHKLVEEAREQGFDPEWAISIGGQATSPVHTHSEWWFHRMGLALMSPPIDDAFCKETVEGYSFERVKTMLEAGRGHDPDLDEKLRLLQLDAVPTYEKSPYRGR